MAVFVCETVDLVFHTRAVARAHALNLAGEHGAAIEARTNDVVGARIGVGHPARHVLGVHGGAAHEAEDRNFAWDARRKTTRRLRDNAVTRLLGALTKVNRAAINARWCAGFQTPLRELQLFESGRQTDSRRIAGTAAGVVIHAHVNLAV